MRTIEPCKFHVFKDCSHSPGSEVIMPGRLIPAAVIAGLVAFALPLTGCDSDSSQTPAPDITGTLLDAAGQPVPGAGILLELATESVSPPLARATIGIGFSVGQEGPVRVWITTVCGPRAVRVLCNRTLPAGSHFLEWDGRNDSGRLLPSGLYWVHIDAGGRQSTWRLLWAGGPFPPAPSLESRVWQATTGADGRFRVPAGCLPFGETVEMITDDTGTVNGVVHVLWQARVWAVHPDFGAVSSDGFVAVDSERGTQVVLRYPAPPG
jgi:hypothetical protein